MKKLLMMLLFFASDCTWTSIITCEKKQHVLGQFQGAIKNFQQRCRKKNYCGPLAEPLREIGENIALDTINESHVQILAEKFRQDDHIKSLAQKIKMDLNADPAIRSDIRQCVLDGNQECCKRFEQHLRTKARQHCSISCLFNAEKKDACMAAVFVAAAECLECPE